MYRSWGLNVVAATLIGFSTALVASTWIVMDAVPKEEYLLRPIEAIALVILGLLLVFFLWRWLSRRLGSMLDLAIFLIVIFAGSFALMSVVVVSFFANHISFVVPVAVAGLCFWILDESRKWLDIRYERVDDSTVAVIQRNNVFHRLEAPGSVWLIGRTEEIAYTISTTTRTSIVDTGMLSLGELNYRYAIGTRFQLDPLSLQNPNDDQLKRMTSRNAIYRMPVQSSVLSAFHQARANQEVQHTLMGDIDWFEALLLVVPGLPICTKMIRTVNSEAAEMLAVDGIVLDKQAGVEIKTFYILDAIKQDLTPARVQHLLQEHRTNFDPAAVTRLREWILKSEPLGATTQPAPPINNGPIPTQTEPLADSPIYTLSPDDLSIMKTIPDGGVPAMDAVSADGAATGTDYALSPGDLSIMKTMK